MPSYALITEGGRHEATVAKTLQFNPGSIVAMDRGYNDYELFGRWTERGVFFVTRLKENALFKIVEELVPPLNSNILSDQLIYLSSSKAVEKCPWLLRRVVVWDPEQSSMEVEPCFFDQLRRQNVGSLSIFHLPLLQFGFCG